MTWTTPATWATDEVPTSAKMNAQIRDNLGFILPDDDSPSSWTPTLQGTSADYDVLGVSGRQYRIGAIQFAWVRFVLPDGTEQLGSGTMFVELPNPAVGLVGSGSGFSGQAIGEWHGRDNSGVANSRGGTVALRSTSPTTLAHFQIAEGGTVNDANPFTWDTNDILTFRVCYLID